MATILRNRIRCRKCKQVITSEYQHDLEYCKCGTVFVDGGHMYLRRGGDRADYDELSKVV